MNDKIIFDCNCPCWTDNKEYDMLHIKTKINYISDLLKFKGYVYLNDIYEIFDANWDPKRENFCILYNNDVIQFLVTHRIETNDYLINIIW